MTKWRSIAVGIVTVWVGAGLAGLQSATTAAPAAVQASTRVFELRTYTANAGKFDAMKVRFRDHILPLFKKHNLTVVGFWTPADPPLSENTLIYILRRQPRSGQEELGGIQHGSRPQAGLGRHGEGRTDQHESRIRLHQSDRLFAHQVASSPHWVLRT